jgi:hypothetical protein
MLTLSYDPKITTKDKAWYYIGKDLNRFLSEMKQEYGNIVVIRSFEAFKNGYPHIHMILGLRDRKLPVYRYNRKKDGAVRYKLSNTDKEKIQSYWHSYIHIEGVQSYGAIRYILKYISKEQFTRDNYNTVAHLWLYHKQAYSISRDFKDYLQYKIEIGDLLVTYTSNSNNNYIGWQYLATITPTREHKASIFEIIEPPPFNKYIEMGLGSSQLPTVEEVLMEVV